VESSSVESTTLRSHTGDAHDNHSPQPWDWDWEQRTTNYKLMLDRSTRVRVGINIVKLSSKA